MRNLMNGRHVFLSVFLCVLLLCAGFAAASECTTTGRGWGPNPDPVADPISDLAAVPGPTSVTLTWTPPEGCTDITLYFKKTANGVIAAVPGATITSAMSSYTAKNLEPGIVYVFFLDVVGGDNQGRSNEVKATPLAMDPTPTPTTIPGPSVTPGPTTTPAPTAVPSVTGAPSVSPGTGASGGGCVAGNVSVATFLLLLPLLVNAGKNR